MENEGIEIEEEEDEIGTADQGAKQRQIDAIRPYQYKKGQSGNPSGRPIGVKSLKQRAKEMLMAMTDDEMQDFFHGMTKESLWKMAEGNPKESLELEEIDNPYANLTREEKIGLLRSFIEDGGDGERKDKPDILDGKDIEISKDGTSPQGGGTVSEQDKEPNKEGNSIIAKESPKDNDNNGSLDNPTTPDQSKPENIRHE